MNIDIWNELSITAYLYSNTIKAKEITAVDRGLDNDDYGLWW